MVMLLYYSEIKWVHVGCVLLSGSLFFLRGVFMMSHSAYANDKRLAYMSYIVDTVLLVAALLLTALIHQYPLVQDWLTAKVLLLIMYIALGVFALRRGKTLRSRTAFFAAAMMVYGFIISVAVTHDPRGVFAHRAALALTEAGAVKVTYQRRISAAD